MRKYLSKAPEKLNQSLRIVLKMHKKSSVKKITKFLEELGKARDFFKKNIKSFF